MNFQLWDPAPEGTAVRRYMRSFQTTGEELPLLGTFTFHLTFFVSLHEAGGSAVADAPVASGPRHAGQYSSAAIAPAAARSIHAQQVAIFKRLTVKRGSLESSDARVLPLS
jgi:hypothetical protein